MQPDTRNLVNILGLSNPLIGLYDAPDSQPFEPLVEPLQGKRACVFAFYKQWLSGQTLHLTLENMGCPGGRQWLCNVASRSREDFIQFLVDEEGLKASHDLMRQWLEYHQGYAPAHPHLLLGPLRADQYQFLKTITFFVNPDQLSLLTTGAQYHHAPGDPPPVIVPFGSGCMQLISLFQDLNSPQAIVGATDIAMRQYIPQEILAFTVTKPMYEQLCALDEQSFLYKPFWQRLKTARNAK